MTKENVFSSEMNVFEEYNNKPIILSPDSVTRTVEGAQLRLHNGSEVIVAKPQIHTLMDMALAGLTSDIVGGHPLSRKLQSEVIEPYNEAIGSLEDFEDVPFFGEPVYYPETGNLVWYPLREWHTISLLARNSMLLQDPERKITWDEQRKIFNHLTIAVAGASVGKSALTAVHKLLHPGRLKVGDVKGYQPSNANRAEIRWDDIGEPKAQRAALHIHEIDPFIPISVYQSGITVDTIKSFVSGNPEFHEPGADYIIEETDDPRIKILIREEARRTRKILFMVTDIGTGVQLDIRNFRDYPEDTLAFGISDEELFTKKRLAEDNPANRDLFFQFAFALIGNNWEKIPAFKEYIHGELRTPLVGGVPQLGTSAGIGGNLVALRIGLMALGHTFSERTFIDTAIMRSIRNQGKLV